MAGRKNVRDFVCSTRSIDLSRHPPNDWGEVEDAGYFAWAGLVCAEGLPALMAMKPLRQTRH